MRRSLRRTLRQLEWKGAGSIEATRNVWQRIIVYLSNESVISLHQYFKGVET